MNDDTPAEPPPEGEPAAEPPQPAAVLNAQGALRALLVLLAIWSAFSGLTLVFFQDASAATIGGGLEGGEGGAAQRLLGVHLLVLAPLYGLIAWDPKRYRLLLWVPYLAQGGVVLATGFDILTGDRDFSDGALPLIVAAIFLALLIYVWAMGREPEPAKSAEEPPADGGETADGPSEPPAPPEQS